MKKNLHILIFLSVLTLYFYVGNKLSLWLVCPIHFLTGFYCPGCGITRMFLAIFSLDFYQAFRYNPLVFILLPFALFLFLQHIFSCKTSIFNRIPNNVWYVLIFIVLFYGILRNVPFFEFLRPTIVS